METRFIKGVSKKNGREYFAVEVTIANDYKKMVFLSDSEVALVKMAHDNDVFENR